MLRTPLAIALLTCLAPVAAGQSAMPRHLPGHMPGHVHRPPHIGGGFGFGHRFPLGPVYAPGTFHVTPLPQYARPAFGPGFGFGHGFQPQPIGLPIGLPVFGAFYGGYGGTTVIVERYVEPAPAAAAPVVPVDPLSPAFLSSQLARQRAATTAATTTTTTRVTLTLPAPAELWLNGTKQPGSSTEFNLESTSATPGESVTFAIKARWQIGEQTYEYDRTLDLMAGQQQNLAVAHGTPVK